MNISQTAHTLPRKIIVSLRVGGAFFALANVICVAILAKTYVAVKHEPRTLEVKGSAKKTIQSDTIGWYGTITARDPDLTKAYDKLKADSDRVHAFVRTAGIPDNEITTSSISTSKIFHRDVIPATGNSSSGPTFVDTQKIDMYVLSQCIHIESAQMDKVPGISRTVTNLIKDGVEIESGSPQYLYSKLSELKVDMLAEATKDATNRATQIVTNANGELGSLIDARMGVMQINPKGVTEVSATGNNDTTSFEKDILAVVTVRFELK